MSVYFILELRIFCDDGKHYDVCYCVLEMFVMMEAIVMFDFYV